jgi:hypothetical protein
MQTLSSQTVSLSEGLACIVNALKTKKTELLYVISSENFSLVIIS